jgi:hypothetical protein
MSVPIDIINASTVVSDTDVQKYTAALQKQVTRDWAPIWGVDASLHFVPKSQTPSPEHWQLAVLDTSDEADALGYHDITKSGLPLGKAFAKSDLLAGASVSVTISHELLEMLGDPDINLLAFIERGTHRGFYSYEVCDPVEDDKLGYTIDGVLVSDFIFPAYFETFRKSGPFDFGKHVGKPLQILPGGYQGIFVPGQGWTQVTAQGHALEYSQLPRRGSRRERRRRNRSEWIPSRV